jgi:hypothetical protein
MNFIEEFEAHLSSSSALKTWRGLDSPLAIQQYLDSLPYVAEERDRSPLNVLLDGQGHCLDGGLFAALALRKLGEPGLILDLVPAVDENGHKIDDDHVLALFRRNGLWGALAKSNFVWLRYREPIHRTLRELVLSYFEGFYSVDGVKSLRGYTRPLDVSRFDASGWAWNEPATQKLYHTFYKRKPIPLISQEAAASLAPVDKRSYDAGSLGTDWNWAYGVRK